MMQRPQMLDHVEGALAQQGMTIAGIPRVVFDSSAIEAIKETLLRVEDISTVREHFLLPAPVMYVECPFKGGRVFSCVIEAKSVNDRAFRVIIWERLRDATFTAAIPAWFDIDSKAIVTADAYKAFFDSGETNDFQTESVWSDRVKETWGQSIIFVAMAFIMMNLPKVAITTECDPAKLNKARVARGKAPFLGYHAVRLNLGDVTRRDYVSSGKTHAERCLHHVRAHLRFLKSGKIVPVAEHWRGNADRGVNLPQYEVTHHLREAA